MTCDKDRFLTLRKERDGSISVMREKISMAKGKPQQTGITTEINSIPTYAI
jgi:hypothetical protein